MKIKLAIYGAVGVAMAIAGAGVGGYQLRGKFDDAATISSWKLAVRQRDAQISQYATAIEKLNARLIADNLDRTKFELKIASWQDRETLSFNTIKTEGQHAQATVNNVCWPTPDERRMRNDAIRTFIAGTVSQTSSSSSGLDGANTLSASAR